MRYRAQLGGQPSRDVLLVRLMDVQARPVVRLRLPEPVDVRQLWHWRDEAFIVSDDQPGDDMAGWVEWPEQEAHS